LVEKLIIDKPKVITEVSINKYGLPKLVSGCKLGIMVTINASDLEYITLGYVIHDDMGRNIHAANMQQYYKKFKVQNDKSRIEVSIDRLPLIPGSYSVSIYLGNGSFDIDIIKNAISFSVFWDETKKEIKPKRVWGVVYAPTKWEYL
jgi:lipopolysaccharide transport system ATP-binding protein